MNAGRPRGAAHPAFSAVVGHRQLDGIVAAASAAARFETLRFGRDGDDHEEVFCRALRWIAGRLTDDPRPDAVFVEAPVNPGAFVGEYDPVSCTQGPDEDQS